MNENVIKTQPQINLELAEQTRDQASQSIKDLEQQRAAAISRKDKAEAMKLSKDLNEAKLKLEIEEVRCSQAQEILARVKADKPKAAKALGEIMDLWSKYKELVIKVSDRHRETDVMAAEIPSLHTAICAKITKYEVLTEEKIFPSPPFIGYLLNRAVPVSSTPAVTYLSAENLTWQPETMSQRIQRNAQIGKPEISQDLTSQMRRYR